MLSRALSLATVMLLIGGFAAAPVRAQNLEAGKSPSQIFGGTCAACHKSPRGLLKTVAPGSLPGFLRQHYTTSGEMASVLSAYLVSSGAADTRYIGSQPKQAKDAKQEPSGQPAQLDRYGRPIRRAPTQEASRPAGEGQAPVATTAERGPDGRRLSAKQRLSKRGKPSEELPKTDAAKTDAPMGEAAKGEVSKDEKPSIANDEGSKPEVKSEEETSESAKLDAPKGEGNRSDVPLRADPVPAVTPAPKSPEGETMPVQSAAPTPGDGPTASPASSASNAVPERQPGEPTSTAAPASVAVSAPPPPPVAPAGPPAPPISQ